MREKLGELFRCSDPRCGFEILVVHESALPPISATCPTCCCGRSMSIVIS